LNKSGAFQQKHKYFGKALLITALALLLITAAALGFLWKYLEDYQVIYAQQAQ